MDDLLLEPSQLRVLMVDDSDDDVELVRLLTRRTRTVQIVIDGEASPHLALQRLLSGDYDVCLLDHALGASLSGLDVLERFRAAGLEVPVVFLTGNDEDNLDLLAMKAGAADFLPKRDLRAPLLERVLRYTVRHARLVRALRKDADTDALTGVANRRAFNRALQRLVEDPGERRFAVLYLDVDGFKAINDQFGHETGDELLRIIGDRLRSTVRHRDIVARLGGDEFAVLVPDCGSIDIVKDSVGRRVLSSLEQPYVIGDHLIHFGASIGLVHSDLLRCASVEGLVQAADRAMYFAKQRGGRQIGVAMRDVMP